MTGPKRPPERLALADGPIDPALRRSSRESRRYLYFATQPTHRRRIRRRKVRITDSKPTLLSSALPSESFERLAVHGIAPPIESRCTSIPGNRSVSNLEHRTPGFGGRHSRSVASRANRWPLSVTAYRKKRLPMDSTGRVRIASARGENNRLRASSSRNAR